MDEIRLSEARRFLREAKGDFTTRADGEELRIEGYFSVFNSSYEMFDNYIEQVKPGAFRETVGQDDIRALINHDTTLVLGRNMAGTLYLEERERGLFGSILINPKDQDAMNVYARVERGDVTQCSIGFDVLSFETEKRDGVTYDYLTKIKLYEVSICTFPAYEATEVKARNAAALEVRRAEARAIVFEAWKNEQLKKLGKE